jgi:hypothetical protein
MSTTLRIELKDKSLENAENADIFLDDLEASKKLTSKEGVGRLYFVSQADLNWCDTDECNNKEYFLEYYTKRIGICEYQFLSIHEETEFALIAESIIELSNNFEIEINYDSTIFDEDSWYFTEEQQRAVTRKGELLSYSQEDNKNKRKIEKYINMVLLEKTFEEINQIDQTPSASKTVAVFMNTQKENKNFYPTPKSLIERMLSKVDYDREIENILEPSAGKGDIIAEFDEFKDGVTKTGASFSGRYDYERQPLKNKNVLAIEKDVELQATLKGKGITVIDSDFLTYNGLEQFDLIVMNPPFDMGATHLHKAMDILFSGQIVCLLNAETIKNPYSNERKDLVKRLKEVDAEIEYIEDAFTESESDRKTGVETALVYINIVKTVESEYFTNMSEDKNSFDEKVFDAQDVAKQNKIGNLVIEYNLEKEMIINQLMAFYKNYNKVSKYLKLTVAGNKDDEDNKSSSRKSGASLTKLMQAKVNSFSKQIKKDYWMRAMDLDEIKKKLTSANRNFVMGQLSLAAQMEFTEQNVYQFILNIIDKFPELIQGAIEHIFDEFTSYAVAENRYNRAEYINNIHYYSGWKTNNAYKVNKKVIQPFYRSDFDWEYNYSISSAQEQFLWDLDMVMSYFMVDVDGIQSAVAVNDALRSGQNKKIDTKYFFISIFKKGTMHIEFKDMDLLRRFNIEACRGKGFLPHDYSTKPFSDLSKEEVDLVHEFESKKDYKQMDSALQIGMNPMEEFLLELKPKGKETEEVVVTAEDDVFDDDFIVADAFEIEEAIETEKEPISADADNDAFKQGVLFI